MGVYISRRWGEETPYFFMMKDTHNVITRAKFGDDRLRGSGVVACQISAFPIDFAGRFYNTVITVQYVSRDFGKPCSWNAVIGKQAHW